jgi:hypothetical protein
MTDLITREAARRLAVSYSAFNAHRATGEHNGTIVWGGILLTNQAAAGITMYEPKLIETLIEQARRLETEEAERKVILETAAYHRARNAKMWRGNDRELMQDAD